jgi:hypothetical protein
MICKLNIYIFSIFDVLTWVNPDPTPLTPGQLDPGSGPATGSKGRPGSGSGPENMG